MNLWEDRTIMYAYCLYNNLFSAHTSLLQHHIHLYVHRMLCIVFLFASLARNLILHKTYRLEAILVTQTRCREESTKQNQAVSRPTV